ncbi:LysR substrate-binding domain-containing protein [Saccharomonospora cyanea]|uniref:Transcriptional regulator n=1 Tax=Saccharomonospora cyanea NA-134 TaxID=882082 RepID=H5XPV3_9PSEU|nr:LysR substrate-binding domain-containing protein [Saccharomonospora cyanea]EHR61160.1 transcriptional regulator [Saccharomonospora cyanea NA-134]
MSRLDRTPSFTFRQLSAFVAVAETGTISAAASLLMVSPSAVSLTISDLEKVLRTQLCVRRRAHGVQLTPTGQAMLARARVLLQQASEMEAGSTDSGGEPAGPLSIGCYPTVGPTVLPPLLARFTELHPAVTIRFHEATADELATKLDSGELDAVIVYDLDVPPTWQSATLLTRHPTLVVANDHPLAGEAGPVALAEVADEPMVLLDTAPSAEHAMRVCAAAGFTPTVAYRTANYETVRAFVGWGLGWTIMLQQPQLNTTYGGLGVVARPIGDPRLEPVRLLIAWKQDVLLSRVTREFIRFAVDRYAAAEGR